MFGLGAPELLLILIIALVVFGPGKLPAIGGALGKSLREFKDAMNAVELDDKKEKNSSEAVTAEDEKNQKTPDTAQKL
jgi:sec-independent protein translocase protein TatA